MAHILIGTIPMVSHLMRTFKFAKDLKLRGHEVTYVLNDSNLGPFIESQGFRFHHLSIAGDFIDDAAPTLLDRLGLRNRPFQRFRIALRKSLIDGSTHRLLLERLNPDIVIIEWPLVYFILPILAWKIPVFLLSLIWPNDDGDGAPLMHSHLIPNSSRLSRFRFQLEWARYKAYLYASNKLFGLWKWDQNRDYRLVAEHYGLTLPDRVDDDCYAELADHIRSPQLYLCPSSFDFPRRPLHNRYFLDFGVWVEKPEYQSDEEFPWHKLKSNTPMIYCSFGTRVPEHGPQSELAKEVLRKIIEAFSNQSELQLVITVGYSFDTTKLNTRSNNIVIIDKWIPQIKVLRRAAVHITHGGLSSIRESMECQVPMIVIPFDIDQPGNAARVVYHNLGVRVFPHKVLGSEIVELAKQLGGSTMYKENLLKMKLELDKREAGQSAADIIESLLSPTNSCAIVKT